MICYDVAMVKNWTKIYKKYKGLWVALAKDEITVLSSAKSLKEASEKAYEKGFNDPIMMFVPKEDIKYFVGAL